MRERALYRLALGTAAVTFPLLCMGGLVTSLDAGLVFLDWPLSNGSLNPDGWTRNVEQAAEHGHRLLGAVVGLFAASLVVAAFRWTARRAVRVLSVVIFACVCAQGLLGGLRVTEQSTELALLHGCFAQIVFSLMVGMAWLCSADARADRTPAKADGRALLAASAAATFLILWQLVLGARLRHVGGPPNLHIQGAVLVFGAVAWAVGLALVRHRRDRTVVGAAVGLGGLFGVQVLLGLVVLSSLGGGGEPYTAARVILPTAHLVVGALLLARAVLLTLHAARRSIPQPAVAVGVAR